MAHSQINLSVTARLAASTLEYAYRIRQQALPVQSGLNKYWQVQGMKKFEAVSLSRELARSLIDTRPIIVGAPLDLWQLLLDITLDSERKCVLVIIFYRSVTVKVTRIRLSVSSRTNLNWHAHTRG